MDYLKLSCRCNGTVYIIGTEPCYYHNCILLRPLFFLENEMHETESRYRNGQTHFLFYHPQCRVGVKCWKTICHRPAPLASQIQLTTQHIERLTAVRVANISRTHKRTHTHIPTFQSLIASSHYCAA